MNPYESFFLDTLKCTCLGTHLDETVSPLPDQFNQVISLISRNNLIPFIYPIFKDLRDKGLFPHELYVPIHKKTVSYLLYNTQMEHNLYYLMRQFLSHDLHPILFKGYVLAQVYPNPLSRISGDTDIFIPQDELSKAVELLQTNHYVISEDGSKDMVTTLINDTIHHKIEMHTALWENYIGKKIDILNNLQMTSPDNIRTISLKDLSVSTLGYNEHLIYQIFHIIKHLFLESISFRYLVDITLYVNKYIDILDVTSFWNDITKLDYTEFTNLILQICHEYLGMTDKIFLSQPSVTDEAKERFLHELMYQDSVDPNCVVRYQLIHIMTPYLTGDANCGESKRLQTLKVLFPTAEGLSVRYRYVKKCPFLLPVAWVHKGLDFIFRRIFRRNTSASMSDKLNGTHEKMDFLSKVGLLK